MVDQNLILIGYAVPLVFGLLMMTKAGDGLSDALSQRNPLLVHARRRHMLDVPAWLGRRAAPLLATPTAPLPNRVQYLARGALGPHVD